MELTYRMIRREITIEGYELFLGSTQVQGERIKKPLLHPFTPESDGTKFLSTVFLLHQTVKL